MPISLRPLTLALMILTGGVPPSTVHAGADVGATFHALLQSGETDKAEALLEGLAGPEARLTRFRGLLALKRGQFQPAREAFARVLELKPRWTSTWMVLAQAQLALQLPAEALDSLERCASLGEGRPGYYRLKARAHLATEQPDVAMETLRTGLLRFPDSLDLEVDSLLILTEAGLHHRAVLDLRTLTSRRALSPRHLRVAGSILAATHQTHGALALLEELLHRYPAVSALRAQAGFAYAKGGNHRTAGRFFALAATLGEDTAFEAADQFRLAGQIEEALKWNGRVSSPARLLPQRLTIYLEAERYHQATSLESLLQRAGLLNDPTRFQLGYAWVQTGDLKRAHALLEAMESSPSRNSLQTMIERAEEFRFQG